MAHGGHCWNTMCHILGQLREIVEHLGRYWTASYVI